MANPGTETGPHGGAKPSMRDMANAIRALSMDAVEAANSGHPGMPMGMADVAAVLFAKFLKFDAGAPNWPDRDRFVLSAGHGSMLLYSVLYLTGYPGVSIEDLKQFRQLGSKTAGHPEYDHMPGIEATAGPLGQGIATAVGMAIAERMMQARYGDGHREPPHLCDRGRRLPDGRHQPRSHRHGRPPEAQQADRALGR
jgi:transketolase